MHKTLIPTRDIFFDRSFFVLLAMVLTMGCRSTHEDAATKADPTIAALNALSSLSDTSAVARRLEVISDSLAGRRPSLPVRIALTHARADLLRRRGMPDSGFSVLLQGLDLALRASDSLALAEILLNMSKWKEQQGRSSTAVTFSKRAVDLYRRHGTPSDLASAMEQLSSQLQDIGNFPGAQAMILEALQIYERSGNTEKAGQAYNVIGNTFAELGDEEKAMQHYRRSADIFTRMKDSARLSSAYANIGLLHRRKDPDSALYYYGLSMKLAWDTRNRLQYVIGSFNQANVFFDRKQYTEARQIYDTVLAICIRDGFSQGIPRVYSGYAALAGAVNDQRASGRWLSTARRIADSSGESGLALWLRKEELVVSEKRRDIDSVIALSKDIRRREDSIAGIEKKALVAELALRYQVDAKEREIGSLRSKLSSRQWLIGLLVCLTLALTSLVLLYRRQRRVLTQRNRSYELMIARYQSERDRLLQPPTVVEPDAQRTAAQDVYPSSEITIPEVDNEAALLAAETLADYQRILALLQEDKLYTRSRLKAEDLADRVGMSPRKLTAVLRAQGEDGFNALLNRFRIAEATRLMEDPESHILKLDTLAERCGFNSRQHFYRVFEQVTGVNPGYYRKRFGTGGKRDDVMPQN